MMTTNEIKKGMRFRLANGWFGTMMDNKRGTVRFAEVEGFYTEMGSVYAHDIVAVETPDGWEAVEHTEKQRALRETVNALFI